MTRSLEIDRTVSGTAPNSSSGRTACALAVASAFLLSAACGSDTKDKPLPPEQRDAIARAAGQATIGEPPSAAQSPSSLLDRLADTGTQAQGSRAVNLVQRATVTVFTSPYAQKPSDRESPLVRDFPAPSATPSPGGPPYPVRAMFEDLDWMAALPPPSEEVPGVRLGWYLNGSIAAFRAAIDQNMPLVLVIGESGCADCTRTAKALRCAAVERLAGDAVFAYSFPSRDKGALSIAGSLKIDGYPAITVLEPESRMLIERARITGFFEATALGNHLEESLWRVSPRHFADFNPGAPRSQAPAQRAARPATALEAESGAKERGLVHGPPAPSCK